MTRPIDHARAGEPGRHWYRYASASVGAYAREHGHDAQRVADILSVVSPRVSVVQSTRLAHRYLSTGETRGMMRSVRAALDHYEATGEIRGPKTSAFARALMGEPDAVVLDAWMAKAFKVEPTTFKSPVRYRSFAARVRGLATRLGWTPAETQAAMWAGARKAAGLRGAGFLVISP